MKRLDLAFAAVRVPVDAAMIFLAGWSAYWIRVSTLVTRHLPIRFTFDLGSLNRALALVVVLWIAVFALNRLYSLRRRSIAEELLAVIYAVSTGMMLVFTVVFFSQQIFESRFIVLAAWGLAMLYLVLARLLLRGAHRWLLSRGFDQRRVVLVGPKETTEPLAHAFATRPGLGFVVVGTRHVLDEQTKSWILRQRQSSGVDDLILANPNATRQDALDLLTLCDQNHINFHFTADLLDAAKAHLVPHSWGGVPVFEVQRTPLDGWGRIYKRAFDIVGSLLLILLTLPIQIVTALALLTERQGGFLLWKRPDGKPFVRIGEGGKPFVFLKFRSMVKDAHRLRYDEAFLKEHHIENTRSGSPLYKFKHDPRITRIGHFIRRTSIDELPQLYLVLAGRMSLVGPRPHLPEEVAQYRPEHRSVLNVKPGITGMAQVSGRSDLDFDEEVRLDTLYIETWSPWLDLVILAKTPWAALRPRKNL